MSIKHFAVKLCIISGEVEKSSLHVVDAQDAHEASKLALQAECHEEDEDVCWEDDTCVTDLNGEYLYRVKRCVEISSDHATVLRTYL
jgi:hypothetical protein